MFNKQFLLVAHNMRSERLTVNFSVGRNCCDSIFVIRFVTCDTSGAGEREKEREREGEHLEDRNTDRTRPGNQ